MNCRTGQTFAKTKKEAENRNEVVKVLGAAGEQLRGMLGDKDAARKSYQDFLTLWKGADPDIPIYRQAKAEYAKLIKPPAARSQRPAKSSQLSAVSFQ